MSLKLKRMGLINWHKINTWQIVNFGDMTFITGHNSCSPVYSDAGI